MFLLMKFFSWFHLLAYLCFCSRSSYICLRMSLAAVELYYSLAMMLEELIEAASCLLPRALCAFSIMEVRVVLLSNSLSFKICSDSRWCRGPALWRPTVSGELS